MLSLAAPRVHSSEGAFVGHSKLDLAITEDIELGAARIGSVGGDWVRTNNPTFERRWLNAIFPRSVAFARNYAPAFR